MSQRFKWFWVLATCVLAISPSAFAQNAPKQPKPEWVHVLWTVPTPAPDVLNIETESGVVPFNDSHKKATAALREAFITASADFDPPWPIDVIARMFAVRRKPGGLLIRIEVQVVDARDKSYLFQGAGQTTLSLSGVAGPQRLNTEMEKALGECASEVARLLVNRGGIAQREGSYDPPNRDVVATAPARKPLPDVDAVPVRVRKNWLGLQVGVPAEGMITFRRELGGGSGLELGFNPGLPVATLHLGFLQRIVGTDAFGMHLGGGVAERFASSMTTNCESGQCYSMSYAYARVGLRYGLGSETQHQLSADAGGWLGQMSKGQSGPRTQQNWMVGLAYFYGF